MPNQMSNAVRDTHDFSVDGSNEQFLSGLGSRVRQQRDAVQMTRRVLAQRSKVSERYLAQLENGEGNMSIGLLRNVCIALDIPLDELLKP